MEMKRTLLLLFAMGTLLTLGTTTSNLMAQGAGAAQPAANQQQKPQIPVVVVDFMYLMEIHPQLYVETNNLNQKIKQVSEKFQNDTVQFQNKQKELQGLTPGTQSYAEKMDELRKSEAEIKLRAMNEEDSLQLIELRANYQAYQEIKAMIDAYAKNNNILLVVNHIDIARRLPKEQSPQTMSAELSQMPTVVYRNTAFDITPAIEKWLNDTWGPKGIPAVDYETVKDQRFGTKPGGAAPQTNVATAGAGGVGR